MAKRLEGSPERAVSSSRLPAPVFLGEGLDRRSLTFAAMAAEAEGVLRTRKSGESAPIGLRVGTIQSLIESAAGDLPGGLGVREVAAVMEHGSLCLSGDMMWGRVPVLRDKKVVVSNHPNGTDLAFGGDASGVLKVLRKIRPLRRFVPSDDSGLNQAMRTVLGEALRASVQSLHVDPEGVIVQVQKVPQQLRRAA